jgi:hypothetical protein
MRKGGYESKKVVPEVNGPLDGTKMEFENGTPTLA